MPIKDILAKHLFIERTKLNLPQEKIAARAGISTRFYQSIETGEKQPTLLNFFKIIKALESDPLIITDSIWKEWQNESD